MRKLLPLLFLLIFSAAKANFYSPGTGVKWTLDDLVNNSAGAVTNVSGQYVVNDVIFIVQNDTLSITTDAVVKYNANMYLDVNGVLLITPPNGVLFTAVSNTDGFSGVRVDSSSSSVIDKLTFEYAVSFRLTDCSPTFTNCIFRYNNIGTTTTFGNGALSLFRSSPLVSNCQFIANNRAAIQGGSNIANAPKIYNCLFQNNNTSNQNVPQINMGASGSDTIKIIGNQIIGGTALQCGGIGFLPTANLNVVIKGNLIKNNRYGISLQGGNAINSLVSYNIIDSNNIQNNSTLGGSGIAYAGGSATSQQNSIATGNLIRGNLWGITIQNRAKPNIGNITNSDTTDDGKNAFIGNTNATTPFIDLYNNSIDQIYAQNNYWGTADPVEIENKIFHITDNSALGEVIYSNYLLPITLQSFTAQAKDRDAVLNWQTKAEQNSDRFMVERSTDARNFTTIGTVTAKGQAATYQYTDKEINRFAQVYYRLKMVDKDGAYSYSNIVALYNKSQQGVSIVKAYPTILNGSEPFNLVINSNKSRTANIRFSDLGGKTLHNQPATLTEGINNISLPTASLAAGIYYVSIWFEDGMEKTTIIKN